MNRRQAVSSGLFALAGSALAAEAPVQAPAVTAAGPFAVRAQESRAGAPWMIAGISPITVKVGSADVDGRYALLELETPQGHGPELHVHLHQNELFFITRGSIGLVCAGQKMVLKAGDTFMVPMNTPHAYVTLSAEPARMLNLFDPAGTMETFFKAYAALIQPGMPPDMEKMKAIVAASGGRSVGPPLKVSDFAAVG